MQTFLTMTLATTIVVFAALSESAPAHPLDPTHCLSPEVAHSKSVFGKVRSTLSRERTAAVRAAMGLHRLPEDSVSLVVDPAVCRRAAIAVGTHESVDPNDVHLVLVRIGSQHWAEDQQFSGGEWPLVFILDSTASRVLGQY
jgi:hypothetical protein